MLPQQRNPCTDCKSDNSAQLEDTPYYSPKLHPGPCSSVWECGEGQTDRHTDDRGQYTLRFGYASGEM